MNFSLRLTTLAIIALLPLCGACKRGHDHKHDHKGHSHGHHHTPPHGGTAVRLGNEVYHLEFVIDASAGRLSVYILDGHMEHFVRSAEKEFIVEAKTATGAKTLTFTPVANTATGETVGDTSLFQAEADWLKSTREFEATLKAVTIRGTKFENVAFHFPKGNE